MPAEKWDSARYLLEREVQINPKFSDIYADLAQVCVSQKDFTAAENSILKFLEFKPQDQIYNNNLVLLFKDQGKYKEALVQADRMIALGLEVNSGLYKSLVDSVAARK
jgi:tetratricopeptide (TPR) repeat protein